MTVWEMTSNQTASVARVDEALGPLLLERLREMGLEIGQAVKLIRRGPIGGPVVLRISDSVFSIEKSVAEKIFITQD